MKKISRLLLIFNFQFLIFNCSAQSLSPSVLPGAGGYFSAANGSLSWTLGETVTSTFSSATNKLTQGFQQPEVQVRVGTLAANACPGSNLSIPFIASGIISPANVFTAQLSNASGNFSSPVAIGTLIGNTSGTINAIIPAVTFPGNGYRIRVIGSLPSFIGPDNGANIVIANTCSITLNLSLLLQGYCNGVGVMQPVLINQGIGNDNTVVDTIKVELHDATSPNIVVAENLVLLHTNGSATCSFPVSSGNYYIVVKHRNTVETWSTNPVSIIASTNYDFRTSSSKAYGNNMVEVNAGVWALFSGDINQDENVDLLDASLLESDINTFQFGYLSTDLNGDGNVDLLDSPVLETNINSFVYANHP